MVKIVLHSLKLSQN